MSEQPSLTPLGDLGVLDRGRSRHRPRYAHHLYGGKYPFIQTGDIKSSMGRITSFSQTYSEAGLEQSRLWDKGTLCITIAANIAETGILDFPACFPDSVVGFLANHDLCDTRYIEYAFRYLRQKIQGDASGSVQDNINLEYLRNLLVPICSLHNQKAIAHILGTLDDKIELNRKSSETLEGIAKALFQSWFVDFDPVRAKAEGRPTGLPDEISKFYPDSFDESELGEIPSGWEVQRLEDLVELSYGKALKETDRVPGPFPVFGSNGVVGSHKEALVEGPGIIVGRKGNPGIVKWSKKDFFPIDTTFYVKPKMEGLRLSFLFYALSNQRLPALSADSAVPGLNRNIAYMNQQVLPPFNIVLAFDQMVSTIFERMSCLSSEEETLSSLRDALLPKLISGELRVSDAQKMLEEVGI